MNVRTILAVIILQLSCSLCKGQSSLPEDSLFSHGIKIDYPATFIPWGIKFKALIDSYSNYGVYKVKTKRTHYILKLDSVSVFNGIKLNMILKGVQDCLFCKKESDKNIFNGIESYSFDDSAFNSLRSLFNKYTQRTEGKYRGGTGFFYSYKINECIVHLGKEEKMGGNYLLIQWTKAYK